MREVVTAVVVSMTRALACAAVAVPALLAGGVAPAHAQDADYFTTTGSADGYRISRDKSIHVIQVTLGLARVQRAVELLQRTDEPEIMALGRWSAQDGYKLLRSAQEGMQAKLGSSKFPNPLTKMQIDAIWSARKKLITANYTFSQGNGLLDPTLRAHGLALITAAVPEIEMAVDLMR